VPEEEGDDVHRRPGLASTGVHLRVRLVQNVP
jgi:hypothetical protein